ncbi:hypothetical protein [Cellulosimicrobium protaetiae]|uniref:Uncharacterized protein n=1 Tax=Cellulosimicrobium protaetiae TaxID=2587808 RepID=A0A6M5U9C0_9MICO|nr:hypothetical protein [Cellulosimicrobium protaetiae]QJW34840.1 hypothetical protein FIC82_000115 [Cellulosimicrobium protaetiae]
MSWTPPPTPPTGHRKPRPTGVAALRAARLRRRTWWLVGTLPVVLALVVLGVKLAFLAPIAAMGKDRYDTGDAESAADYYGIQRTLNIVEPWKAHYNHGTALARSEDSWALYDAITSLDRAYDLAEHESPEERCMIQTNLSLTYEIQGDGDMAYADGKAAELALVEEAIAARDAGLPYDEEVLDPYGDGSEEPDPEELRQDVADWYEYAEREYATAEQIRGWPDCGESEQTPEQEEQDEAALQRLQDKQQQAQDSQPENQGGGDTQEGEGSEGDEQSEASGGEGSEGEGQQSQAEREEQQRQQELEQQGSEARDEQERLEQEYRDLYGDQPGTGTDPGDGSGSGTKNW